MSFSTFTAALISAFTLVFSTVNGATLLHRYSFDDDLLDSVGTDHGTAVGLLSYDDGNVIFSDGAYITLNRAASVLGTADAVTIDMWVNIHSGNTGWTKLFQFGSNNGNCPSIHCYRGDWSDSRNNKVGCTMCDSSGGTYMGGSKPFYGYMHATFVFKSSQYIKIYIDGILHHQESSSTPLPPRTANEYYYLGATPPVVNDPMFKGAFDEFRIYEGELSPDEIANYHSLGPDLLKSPPPTLTPTASPTPSKSLCHCSEQYQSYGDACYKLTSEHHWLDAQAECESIGGNLVTIESQEENIWIRNTYPSGTYPKFWIGLTDIDEEGLYKWTDGSTSGYRAWAPTQPDNGDNNEDCCNMHTSSGGWNDYPCDTFSLPGLCKIRAPKTSYCGYCEEDEQMHGSSCYTMKTETSIYRASQAECESIGGNLVTIESQEENIWIRNTYPFGTYPKFWIGLTDIDEEGLYKWTDGSTSGYRAWAPTQPDNADNNEDCGNMHTSSGGWNDYPCDTVSLPGLCKMPALIAPVRERTGLSLSCTSDGFFSISFTADPLNEAFKLLAGYTSPDPCIFSIDPEVTEASFSLNSCGGNYRVSASHITFESLVALIFEDSSSNYLFNAQCIYSREVGDVFLVPGSEIGNETSTGEFEYEVLLIRSEDGTTITGEDRIASGSLLTLNVTIGTEGLEVLEVEKLVAYYDTTRHDLITSGREVNRYATVTAAHGKTVSMEFTLFEGMTELQVQCIVTIDGIAERKLLTGVRSQLDMVSMRIKLPEIKTSHDKQSNGGGYSKINIALTSGFGAIIFVAIVVILVLWMKYRKSLKLVHAQQAVPVDVVDVDVEILPSAPPEPSAPPVVMKSCVNCRIDFPEVDVLSCPVGHFYCRECLDETVEYQCGNTNRGKFTADEGRLSCLYCPKRQRTQFSDEDIIPPHISANVYRTIRTAREELLSVKSFAQAQERLARELLTEEGQMQHCREYIESTIVVLDCLDIVKCPNQYCKTSLHCPQFFNSCFALKCDSCEQQFCGWCLTHVGDDAHQHVRQCRLNPRPGNVYAPVDVPVVDTLMKQLKLWRRNEIETFLASRPVSDATKARIRHTYSPVF